MEHIYLKFTWNPMGIHTTFDFFIENIMILKINRFLYRFLLHELLQIYLLETAIPLITQREREREGECVRINLSISF